ncbi:MAG: undecaprenyl-diphosphate phosphatase [Lachnospiraceae bacterium]|nr:undecaprenyl-diphosphate phosphatase [Lachnospiraceae bacterium]
MGLLESIFLGIVQGLTEFLPVSSSGHLSIFQVLFGMDEVPASFDVMLHVGTLIAVFICYWNDIWKLIKHGFGMLLDVVVNAIVFVLRKVKKSDLDYRKVITNSYRKFALMIIVSTIPTGIIGILIEDISDFAASTLIFPGICLLITGVILQISDHLPEGTKVPKTASYTNAFIIGIAQGLAVLPGISRSGTTITCCQLNQFERKFAVKYSFIMSIPAILGAAVLKLPDAISEGMTAAQGANYIVGVVVAAVVGFVCIKWMLVLIKNKGFRYFSYYCFAVGVLSILIGIFR